MINRRSFIKRVLGIAALPVAGIAKVLKPEPTIEVPVLRIKGNHSWTFDELKSKHVEVLEEIEVDYIDDECKECPKLKECIKHPHRTCKPTKQFGPPFLSCIYCRVAPWPNHNGHKKTFLYYGTHPLPKGALVRFVDDRNTTVERVEDFQRNDVEYQQRQLEKSDGFVLY